MKINNVSIPAEIDTLSDDALQRAVSHVNGPFDRNVALARLIGLIGQHSKPRGRRASGCSTEASARVTKHRLLAAVTSASGTAMAQQALDKALARLAMDSFLQRYLSPDELETAAYTGNKPARKPQETISPYSEEDMSMLGPGETYSEDGDIVAAYSPSWHPDYTKEQ